MQKKINYLPAKNFKILILVGKCNALCYFVTLKPLVKLLNAYVTTYA